MTSRQRDDVTVTDVPLPEGEQLALVAREAAESGQVVYLTDRRSGASQRYLRGSGGTQGANRADAEGTGRRRSARGRWQLTGQIMGVVLSYVIVPEGSECRLLLKVAAVRGRAVGPLLAVGDLVMVRRQLLNRARLTEHLPVR